MPREIKEIKDFLQGEEEGRQERQDKEERRQCQVQGPLFSLPLHPEDHRQGEGREAEAVSAPWSASEGVEVDLRNQYFVFWQKKINCPDKDLILLFSRCC